MRKNTASPQSGKLTPGEFHMKHRYTIWRERGTADWLLIYTIRGRCRFGFAEGEFFAQPGDMVLLRPHTLHDYGLEKSKRQWDLIWTHFIPRPEWHDWLKWPEAARGVMRLSIADREIRERVLRRFRDANRLAHGPFPRSEALAMNALEEVLLWCDAVNPSARERPLDTRVRRAVEFLSSNFADETNAASLARRCGISQSRLACLFREQVGKTPQQFLEDRRMMRARQLLERTQSTIAEIAEQVGFKNPFYFTLRFKRQTGHSPRDYRAKFMIYDR